MNLNSPDILAKEMQSRLLENKALNLLDVREPVEFHTHNIGGINIPVNKLLKEIQQLPWQHSDEIIVICSTGIRSKTAQSILKQNGYLNARNLKGGLLAIEKLQSKL